MPEPRRLTVEERRTLAEEALAQQFSQWRVVRLDANPSTVESDATAQVHALARALTDTLDELERLGELTGDA